MSSLLAILILAFFIIAFGAGLLFLVSLIGPKRQPSRAKLMAYESGIPGQETKESKVSVKFYLTAILFILFDIEIIFMYPLAVTYLDFINGGLGLFILGEMLVFVLLFVIALVWLVKSKALDWN